MGFIDAAGQTLQAVCLSTRSALSILFNSIVIEKIESSQLLSNVLSSM